jgi:serine/threonine protein kinase
VSIQQRVRMMRDAVNAIAFLHSKGYMHCDIKSLNFLVTEVDNLFLTINASNLVALRTWW